MVNNTPNWARGVCIGRGSFGTVNLAVDKSNGEIFAVKSVNKTTERFTQALDNEIRILKSLSSPFVVKYRGDDVTSENSVDHRNLHMEYMPGGTVADVDAHDDVTIQSYTRCIVSALSYIHSRNIVHCDVKGRNVLVGSGHGSAKLADFGSAIELGGSVSGTRGSPLSMAPEVIRGEYQGPESDVWSLGCTVIEMVTGKPAWQDRGVDTLFQIGYSDELPKLPAQLSDDLRDFISKCIKRNRSERWSCDQLLQHPFLLPCTHFPSEQKLSPRCVFDWSESNFPDFSESESSGIENLSINSNSSNVKQRIGRLCSGTSANWESDDGWELVRNAVVTTVQPFTISSEEMPVTWPEYSDSAIHNDDQCTNNHAESTSSSWSSRGIDIDNIYNCSSYVSLNKLLLFNLNITRHVNYKHKFLFNFIPISDLVSVYYCDT